MRYLDISGCSPQRKDVIKSALFHLFYVCEVVIVADLNACLSGESGLKPCYSSLLNSFSWSCHWLSKFLNRHISTSTKVGGMEAVTLCLSTRPMDSPVCHMKTNGCVHGRWEAARGRQLQISGGNLLFNVGAFNGSLIRKLRPSHSTLGSLSENPILAVKLHLAHCRLPGTLCPCQLWVTGFWRG